MRNLKNGRFGVFGTGRDSLPSESDRDSGPRSREESRNGRGKGGVRMPEIVAVLVKKTLSDCWLAETGQGNSRRAEELGRNCC